MTEKRAVEINKYQHRGLSVGMGLLDEALCEITQWAEGREFHSLVYREINDLDSDERSRILSLIAEIREVVSNLRDALQLTPHVIDARLRIQSHCSILWEQMCELESRHLRRYGEVSPGMADCLDPQIQRIIEHVNRLSRVVRR